MGNSTASRGRESYRPSHPTNTFVNLCNFPPWVIGSEDFNRHPAALELSGVRQANRYFFDRVGDIDDAQQRGEMLNEYMQVKFQLHEWKQHTGNARRGLRNSYVRFLRGWGVDANSIEGAVLKDWVRSRFGLRPTYHRGKLLGSNDDDDLAFAIDRMKGTACTNSIYSQFDLLYEFCQDELHRRYADTNHLTLYRGTYDVGEYEVVEQTEKRRQCVRLNNLSSFTSDRECAWEFGSRVWEVTVPLAKVVFVSDLLPNSILRGEKEYLVIGGEYRVREMIY